MNSSSYGYSYSGSGSVTKNVIVLALGLIINYINGTLIHTFRKHEVFHVSPRYTLFIHLVVNDMIQLTTSISLFVFAYILHKINASFCCLLITFAIFTTLNTPLNLAVMAVECCIAVCLPLQHAELCTIKRTYIMIGWIWAMSAVSALPDVFIFLATEPVELFYSTIYCERDNLFRHPIHLKKRDVSHIIYLIGVWLTLFCTYFKIFLAAKEAKLAKSDQDPNKARNTILLHSFQLLLCMLTYVGPAIKKALLYWFTRHISLVLYISFIIIQILPRFVSPIVYGLRDKIFRQHLKKYLLCSVRVSIKPWTAAKFMLLC